jgi:hypothetical protein
MSVWDSFNDIASVDEVAEAKENIFENPTEGDKPCELISIVASETQQGTPIAKFVFKNLTSGNLVQHSMFLVNQNNPEYTAKNIAAVINFAEKVSGSEITFTSFGKLAEDLEKAPVGAKSVLNFSYRDGRKYPDISFVQAYFGGDAMPFK